jgi:hypothetical protein
MAQIWLLYENEKLFQHDTLRYQKRYYNEHTVNARNSNDGNESMTARSPTFRCAQRTGRFIFVPRGKVTIKGKGEMETYFLKSSQKKSIWEIIDRQRGSCGGIIESLIDARPSDETLNSIDGYEELSQGIEIDAKGTDSPMSRTCAIS